MATPQGWPNLRILPLRLFAVQISIDLPHRAGRVDGHEHLDLILCGQQIRADLGAAALPAFELLAVDLPHVPWCIRRRAPSLSIAPRRSELLHSTSRTPKP